MAVQSKIQDILPADYGYVIFAAIGGILVNAWQTWNVIRARKKCGGKLFHTCGPAALKLRLPKLKYPLLYSPDNQTFNCIQRAHQNTLETNPHFLFLLLVGGLQYPRVAAAGGVVCLIGRIAYTIGYSTGEPEKRSWGRFAIPGVLTLLGCTVSFAAHQLKLIK